MEEFLTFRKMLTPLVIQALFWLGVVVTVIVGLVMIVSGASARYGGGEQVLTGVLTLLLGPIIVRIWCEVLILLFRIHDALTEIKDRLGKG